MRLITCKMFSALIIAAMIGLVPVSGALAQDNPLPFKPGEKLHFVLKWQAIKAGEAVLEVLPVETIKGVPTYHFVMTAKSTRLIDTFYKVRDRIDAYAHVDMSRSLLYKKKQREGRNVKDVTIDFDWDKQQARYNNQGRARDPIDLIPGSLDPLSALYFTRTFDLGQNTLIECPVTDGKKNVIGQARVLRRETITTSSGTFDTFVVEPNLRDVGGVFKKSKNAKLHVWVTADERRLPVKIRSKVIIGSFTGELVAVEGDLKTVSLKDPAEPANDI